MGRRILLWLILIVAVLVLGYLAGPRVSVDTTSRFDPSAIGPDPQTYLDKSEAVVANIRPGLQKEIIWADPAARLKTALAVVYVHGFSASKGEVRPLPDQVARALGANLFYTRLTGHGQDNAAMGTATLNDWINDYQEALAVGRAIGEKVIVIATSTGAALAVHAATVNGASDGIVALALISPNFGVKGAGSSLLTGPWGRQIAELLIGKERSFQTRNAMQEKLWTWRYPTRALLPMGALTELAYAAPVENTRIPALFIFSDSDQVVRQDLTREVAARWGAPHELVPVDDSDDPYDHVIAGDAMSASTTRGLAERIVAWVKAVVP